MVIKYCDYGPIVRSAQACPFGGACHKTGCKAWACEAGFHGCHGGRVLGSRGGTQAASSQGYMIEVRDLGFRVKGYGHGHLACV